MAQSVAVIWTVAARRQLRQALAKAACRNGRRAVAVKMDELTNRLETLFLGATGIVVQQQFVGFRPRDNEFILLVEVEGTAQPGRHVVKLGPRNQMVRELEAWDSCQPHGLRHDLVLMPLEARPNREDLVGLVYGDAQQFLGVPATTPLENAFLGAVCFDTPSAGSVALLLGQLYERIGHLLYAQSFIEDPSDAGFVLRLRHFDECFESWQNAPLASYVRQFVNTWTQERAGLDEFRDPIDFFRFARSFVNWEEPQHEDSDTGPAPGNENEPASAAQREPAKKDAHAELRERWLPRMLRGCAHGDLHGRNVLVGIVRNRALWPAVFDYEDMSPCNLVGWDFVKMETELKMRAFPALYPGDTHRRFVRSVQDFEIKLAEDTETCHDRAQWPESVDVTSCSSRLHALLLALRQQAALHLGTDRGRPREWLHEYYFLLACYGIGIVRFENLQDRERIGAYVGAGVATARFLWGCEKRWGNAESRARG